jgi:3-carboxy-cis,cis-muconate cycloisomerase
MPPRLIDSLATTGALADLFSDESILQAMLEFEGALARAEGKLGIIPRAAASAIVATARAARLDGAAIAAESPLSGTPAVPFLRAFRESVRERNPAAAGFVHWGATSQDLCDTALVLLLRQAQWIFDSDLRRLEQALHRQSQRHRRTVMLGRTLLQPAPPVTFGLKSAGWLGAVYRGHERFTAAFAESMVLQFGGASGTLAALDKHGPRLAQALADELQLACPEAPWHAHRDRLAALLCACGVLTGSLGKMARDVILLAQNEVAEAGEPAGSGRGGSSTMPHKHNPVGSVLTQAAAQRVPALVSGFLSAMVQEHERAAGGWQAEWPLVCAVVQGTGLAIASMAEVAEGLTVDAGRMSTNLAATRGSVFAERAAMLLGKKTGGEKAHQLLKNAAGRAAAEERNLSTVLAEMPEVTEHLSRAALRNLENPEHYLGAAEEFRRRLLAAVAAPRPRPKAKSTPDRSTRRSIRGRK